MRKSILLGAVSALLAGTATAQDGTDTCTAPTAIGEGTFAFDSTANTQSGFAEGACGTLNFFADQFWVYTATAAGDLTIDTEGSSSGYDTQLAVYSGVDCTAVCVGEDDDGGTGLLSSFTVTGVNIGDQFLIQVGGFNSGDAQAGTLNVAVVTPPMPPVNDDCSGAIDLVGTGAFPFDATIAADSAYAGDGGCALDSSIEDVFFTWTAPADGDFSFETLDHNVSYDTRMSIYLGQACDATDVCVGSDDDGGPGFGSLVSLTGVTAGSMYTIQIGVFSASTTPGPNTLNITQAPDGSSCELALPITGTGDTTYDTTGLPTSGYDPIGCAVNPTRLNQDRFFTWTPPTDGDYIINTRNTDITMGVDDTQLVIYGGDCVTPTCITANEDISGSDFLSEVTLTGATTADTYLIHVGTWDTGDQGPLTLTIELAVDPCGALVDDSFEENDTCATAASVGAGSYTGNNVSDTDADFYVVTVPAGNILTFTEDFDSDSVSYNIYDDAGTCGNLLGTVAGGFTLNNTGAASLDAVIEAVNTSALFACGEYDFSISIDVDPCGSAAVDDSLEDNDDCATATPMMDGTTMGLFVSKTDKDHYAVCLANGATIQVDLTFLNDNGDLDCFLWDAADANCGTGNGSTELAEGFSGTDNETMSYTNTTGADQDLIIEVNVWDNAGNEDCNTYDLTILGAGNCNGQLGTEYCTANPNSTGSVSTIYGTGSNVAADNNFTLVAEQVPNDQFMYFIGSYGQDQVNNPGGSNGNLCVGGGQAIARFLPTTGTTAGNMHSGMIDLTDVPLNTGMTEMIIAGDTFNFQGWHREDGGQSNFTPGLEVTFQ